MKKLILTLVTLSVTLMFAANSAFAAGIEGSWTTPDKKTIIKISQCGGGVCGTITQASEKGAIDKENEDPKLRGRPIKGMQLFNLKDTSNAKKWEGELYNPRDGKTYSGYMELLGGDNRIKLEGCVFVFCKGETWSRI